MVALTVPCVLHWQFALGPMFAEFRGAPVQPPLNTPLGGNRTFVIFSIFFFLNLNILQTKNDFFKKPLKAKF